jgi:hypothetical protein
MHHGAVEWLYHMNNTVSLFAPRAISLHATILLLLTLWLVVAFW